MRSLRLGTWIGITLRRWKRSSRKRPSAISFFRSLFVAAITRTSTLHVLVAAHGRDAALLQGAQHLGLGGQAHVADLVQEERAAIGQLEFALAVLDGAGEAALHVAEELALDQFAGDGGTVHLDEGPLGALALFVQQAVPRLPCRPRFRR